MFEQNRIIKSSAQAEAWLRAVVLAYGEFAVLNFVEDCEEIVRHFAEAGVSITANEAYSFWNAYSESMSAGWIALFGDSIAALDCLVEDIESGACQVNCLNRLRGTVSIEA